MSRQTALVAGQGAWALRALTADEEQRFAANEEQFRREREIELEEAEREAELPPMDETHVDDDEPDDFDEQAYEAEQVARHVGRVAADDGMRVLGWEWHGSNDNVRALAGALPGNTTLQMIDIRDSSLDGQVGMLLAAAVRQSNVHIVMTHNCDNLGPQAWHAISEACVANVVRQLAANSEQLEAIELGGSTFVDDAALQMISTALRGNTHLRSVNLCGASAYGWEHFPEPQQWGGPTDRVSCTDAGYKQLAAALPDSRVVQAEISGVLPRGRGWNTQPPEEMKVAIEAQLGLIAEGCSKNRFLLEVVQVIRPYQRMLWRAAWMDSGLSEDLFELVGDCLDSSRVCPPAGAQGFRVVNSTFVGDFEWRAAAESNKSELAAAQAAQAQRDEAEKAKRYNDLVFKRIRDGFD